MLVCKLKRRGRSHSRRQSRPLFYGVCGVLKLRENCIKDFIEKARQYVEMPVLTPELIKVFIKRIEVFEKKEKYSHTCGNRIVIYFTFQADKGTKIDGTVADSKIAEAAE